MISRQALLISAEAKGAINDAGIHCGTENIKHFLMTPQGGAWREDEIILLENPPLASILSAVQKSDADYTITYFSGNSFSDHNGRRFLVLDEDFFEDTELLNASSKQLVLVDSHTGDGAADLFDLTDKPADHELARKMYDKWIDRCEPGQLILHATSKNTTAIEGKSGFFTKKLMYVGGTVPRIENKFNLKNIIVAGHEIQPLLLEEGCDDGPAISYKKGNTLLPFALALPLLRSLPAPRTGNDITGLTLSVFLMALFMVLGEG